MVSHGNLVANQTALRDRCGIDRRTTVVSWLPLFHDMRLCTAVVLPLVSDAAAVTMQPTTFVRDPRVWLRAVGRYDDVFSAAPDFAYDLCLRRIPEPERRTIDLSTWRVAASGSEPVRAGTLRRFAAGFRTSRFRAEMFTPGYGLAECTLSVTMVRPSADAPVGHYDRAALAAKAARPVAAAADGVVLVDCGAPIDGVRIRIVNPVTRTPAPERTVGEILVDAPGNAAGYWGREPESAEVFGARLDDEPGRAYVRTGDLGVLDDGELYVTGRLKDVLIIKGENYFPQDLEVLATAAHPAFEGGRAGGGLAAGRRRARCHRARRDGRA